MPLIGQTLLGSLALGLEHFELLLLCGVVRHVGLGGQSCTAARRLDVPG